MRASALVAFCMLWSGTTSAQVPGEGSTDLLRYYGERAALIQMVGELPDAIPRLITQGSGFLIDDRLVLTADHILPETGDDYKRTYVNPSTTEPWSRWTFPRLRNATAPSPYSSRRRSWRAEACSSS
jgi:hypothetical protein